jgi:hypothetical protein
VLFILVLECLPSYIAHWQGNLVDWNPPISLHFCSMTVDPALTYCPKYYVLTLSSFLVIHSFILQLLLHKLISLVLAHTVMLLAMARLVARSPMARVACVQSSLHSFFVSVCYGFGDHNFFFPHSLCIIILLFLCSFTYQNESSVVGFSAWKIENTPIFYNSEALHIVGILWNILD